MKTIKKRISRLVFADSLVLISTVLMIINEVYAGTMHISLIGSGVIFFILSGLLVREYCRYKDAKLIMENEIMYIQIAKIEGESFKTNNGTLQDDGIEAHISCFGIVLDSKVIKYNIDGIALKSIEIGREFISFVYGANGKDETLRILHGAIKEQEIQGFIKMINYETGVNPLVTN